jgi:SAM-dependent methyltransferase
MENAIHWDLFYKFNPHGGPWENEDGSPDEHVVDFVKNYNLLPNSIVLDAGCADGKNATWLATNGFNVYGIDISPTVISRIRQKITGGKFKSGDIISTGYQNNFFDVIIDAGAMHVNPLDNFKEIFKEYYRILKNDSIMFVRLFYNNVNINDPIFHVVSGLPVYGCDVEFLKTCIDNMFIIEKQIYDKSYGSHGLGCNYFYLRKK